MSNKAKTIIDEIEVTYSSGNIYADTNHPNPEEAMAKAELALLIATAIKKKKLTQKKAAALIGIDQPKISDILRGKLSGFTIDRLFRILRALGIGIEIGPIFTEKDEKPHLLVLPYIDQTSKNRRSPRAC